VAEALLGLGCRYGQGIYFGEPVPASGLAGCLQRGKI
jgi:EAL domain-containing protein (putative c-di-GMP-specific phosphodiesterase class I)